MADILLKAKLRKDTGKRNRKVRTAGEIPAVVYGPGLTPISVQVNAKEFKKAITGGAGLNAMITLDVGENGTKKTLHVITYELQRDPLSSNYIHIDFRQVSLTEKIKVKVAIALIGVPTGVKDGGGVLVQAMHEVEIKCNPSIIPDRYAVNVEALDINNSIHVSDLPKIDGVDIVSEGKGLVVTVSPPTKEEEVVAGPSEAEVLAEKTPEGGVAAPAKADGKVDAKAPADAKAKAPAADAKAAKPEKK